MNRRIKLKMAVFFQTKTEIQKFEPHIMEILESEKEVDIMGIVGSMGAVLKINHSNVISNTFKSFWYGSNKWIENNSYQLLEEDENRILIIVDSNLTNWGFSHFEILLRYTAFKDMLPTIDKETSNIKKKPGTSKNIFIIHGHDEAKLLELEKLIKEEFKLNPVILKDQPSYGAATIIEKFERYANQCSFAISLFTPDDIIEKDGVQYLQARPNVIYELGWFSAKLGRQNTMLLLKEGTNIFSDFQGVMQIRFKKDISEKYTEIRNEFKAVGLI